MVLQTHRVHLLHSNEQWQLHTWVASLLLLSRASPCAPQHCSRHRSQLEACPPLTALFSARLRKPRCQRDKDCFLPIVFLKQLQLLPSINSHLLQLRDPEGQGAHEIVPAGQVPVPDLHRQPPVLVRLLQLAGAEEGERDRLIVEGIAVPPCPSMAVRTRVHNEETAFTDRSALQYLISPTAPISNRQCRGPALKHSALIRVRAEV